MYEKCFIPKVWNVNTLPYIFLTISLFVSIIRCTVTLGGVPFVNLIYVCNCHNLSPFCCRSLLLNLWEILLYFLLNCCSSKFREYIKAENRSTIVDTCHVFVLSRIHSQHIGYFYATSVTCRQLQDVNYHIISYTFLYLLMLHSFDICHKTLYQHSIRIDICSWQTWMVYIENR